MQESDRAIFHAIKRQGRIVQWSLAGFATVQTVFATIGIAELIRPSEPTFDGMPLPYGRGALASLIALTVVGIIVLRWIYRANANAQKLADGMSISPGWNVGWYFIPIASLWQPFTGMVETWAVSHRPEAWRSVPVPALLRWWWTAWLAFAILDNVSSTWTTFDQPEPNTVGILFDLASSLGGIVAAILLITIVRRLSTAQTDAMAARGTT